ncbi:hypothetical protein FRC12_013330 [Ceratobasidium sp. 428]|nr:hypothetical protein FRC12_013330 [Ceratobasidium sp. 428]
MVVLPKNDLCHALVLQTEGRNTGKIIDLETLSYQKASAARAQMTSLIKRQGRNTRGVHQASKTTQDLREILSMLWADLVQPVLDALGYTNKPPPSQLPHITWCLTGPLTSLPVHAAGDYGKPDCALFDYAISSYTPNLSSLLVPPADLSRSTGMVAVSQKSTSGMETLPGTQPELDQICLRTKDTMPFTRIDGDQATPSAVLTAMERHSWVHLACHASQNPKKPTASAFHLHGGPLDLAAITRKQLKHADLAFLSACQTATGDHDLPEEAVHLAAGMIVAGYRRVIATMWSINDEDAPLIADKFYAYMLDDTIPDVNKAAKALHFAVECLRNEVGVKEFVRWVPYIHIGL